MLNFFHPIGRNIADAETAVELSSLLGRLLLGLQMAVEADSRSTYFGAVWAGVSVVGWWWRSLFLSLQAVLLLCLCGTAEFNFMTCSYLHRFLWERLAKFSQLLNVV